MRHCKRALTKNTGKVLLTVFLLLFLILLSVFIGSSNVGFLDVISIILNKLFSVPLSDKIPQTTVSIIWTLRLPRVLLVFLVGGALAVSGCATQSVLKNPLASPYTLGVSSGASLGAGIVILFGLSLPFLQGFTLPAAGFISALVTILLILLFSSCVDFGMSNMTIILAGMVFSLFLSACLTILTALSKEHIEQVTLWQMGSFSMRGWSYLLMFLPFLLIGLCILFFLPKEMDLLTFGEEQAKAAGVSTKQVKWLIFLAVATLTGAAVAICGTIGFVDLISPHLARRIFGSRHRLLLPMCFLTGGALMLLSDLAARTLVSPSELPVGAVTALIGAPFFAYLYFGAGRQKRH